MKLTFLKMGRSTTRTSRPLRNLLVKRGSCDEMTTGSDLEPSINVDPCYSYRNKFVYCVCSISVIVVISIILTSSTLFQNESPGSLVRTVDNNLRPSLSLVRTAVQDYSPFHFRITSSAFANGQRIPSKYNSTLSPPLQWRQKPSDTQSFALIVEYIDTIDRQKHWVIYNIPSDVTELSEGIFLLPSGCSVLLNDWNHLRYDGPSLSYRGHSHRFMFRLIALNVQTLDLSSDTKYVKTYKDLEHAMNPYILNEATLMGTYEQTMHNDPKIAIHK